jgi:hypothetical protein
LEHIIKLKNIHDGVGFVISEFLGPSAASALDDAFDFKVSVTLAACLCSVLLVNTAHKYSLQFKSLKNNSYRRVAQHCQFGLT